MATLLSWIHRAYEGTKKTVGDIADRNNPNATAYIVAHDRDGTISRHITPGLLGSHASFTDIPNVKYATLVYLEIWQKPATNMHRIKIEGKMYTVPLPNWTRTIAYVNTSLPQDDDDKRLVQRKQNLEDNRCTHVLVEKHPKLPLMLKHVPCFEDFSLRETFDLAALQSEINNDLKYINTAEQWKSITELKDIFKSGDHKCNSDKITPPGSFDRYMSDIEFGRQRIAGTNNIWIKKCTLVDIQQNIKVTDKMCTEVFKNEDLKSFTDALNEGRIFIIDHSILRNCDVSPGLETCAPIALLYRRKDKELVPIAIQLNKHTGPDNPVFLPSDPKYTWIIAKMWFNNADAAIHEAITHLGFTHLIMEGIAAISYRHLALSHPVYKLLAPHFLNIHAINALALELLANPGGILDKITNIGSKGIFTLIESYTDRWQMDVEGTVPKDFITRGVDDENALPGYYFRDDAKLIYNAIRQYVDEYLELYYKDNDKSIAQDYELQNWRREMVGPSAEGGLGIKGVPGEEGKFNTKDEISLVLACIIYTCSAGHAAANFKQYDEYCFPPNYPLLLHGSPPKNKIENPESVILKMIADKKTTKETISIVKILSTKATQPLGDFEVNYIHDSEAQEVCKRFQKKLRKISNQIRGRNASIKIPYPYLDPAEIPNSISI